MSIDALYENLIGQGVMVGNTFGHIANPYIWWEGQKQYGQLSQLIPAWLGYEASHYKETA